MEESVIFSLEKTSVKPGNVLIETVLSGDTLYTTTTTLGLNKYMHTKFLNENHGRDEKKRILNF